MISQSSLALGRVVRGSVKDLSSLSSLRSLAPRLASACNRMGFHTQSPLRHGHGDYDENAPTVRIIFRKEKDGEQYECDAPVGIDLLRLAQKEDIDLEGACEGSLACSTCHVVLPDEVYDILEEPSEDEEDMLDLAFRLTETSRLGCQVIVTPDMEGTVVRLPAATRNMYVDGHKPQRH